MRRVKVIGLRLPDPDGGSEILSRTTASLDDDLLQDARRLLGTSGIGETVNAALAVAVRQARLAAFDVRRIKITDDDIATARADRSDAR